MLEMNVYGLWAGKQSAKGTPQTTPAHRFNQVAGGFQSPRDDGSENFSDLNQYGQYTDWVNSSTGNGTPGVEATASELAWLSYIHHGGETVAAAVNEVQTLTATGPPTAGTFTLTYTPLTGAAQTTATIAYNASAANVQTALVALTGIGSGQVVCAGGPLPGTPVTITFQGTAAGLPQQLITANSAGLTGGTVAVAQTTPGTKPKHTTVPLPGLGFWASFYQRTGVSQIIREQYNDCQISQLQIEGSTANKAVRVTPTILSLDPAVVFSSDPLQAMPSGGSLLYTDGTGTFTIDGTAISAQSQFTLVCNKALTPVYGDDTVPVDIAIGNSAVTISVTLAFEAQAAAEFNNLVYGTTTPTAGTKPIKTIPALGSYSFDLKGRSSSARANGDRFKLTIPGVKWTVPDAPNPAPDGGTPEIALAGAMRVVAGQSPYTVDVYCNDAAFSS